MPGINLEMKCFQKMPQLRELKIEAQKPPGTEIFLKLNQLQQLLDEPMKLNCLLLQNFTIDCEDDSDDLTNKLSNLKILHIGIITKNFWCPFTDYLKLCYNLKELTIHLNDCSLSLNIKIIDILSKYCKHLKALHLENCQINLDNFCILKDLLELTLNACGGLTFANLQQILGGLNLKSFSLINTQVIGNSNHIFIAKTLESITVDSQRFSEISEIFHRSLNNFDHLLTLNWLKGYINHTWITEKCPNLEYLRIPNAYFLQRIIETMASLRELTITSCNGLTWPLLQKTIRTSRLKRLHLLANNLAIDKKTISSNLFLVNTSLEWITMPYQMFSMSLKHWVDLLDMNEHLRLVIFGKAKDILSAQLMLLLLGKQCIQNRCDNIKICGFSLDLKDFERNASRKEFVKLHINTNHYREKNMHFTLEL